MDQSLFSENVRAVLERSDNGVFGAKSLHRSFLYKEPNFAAIGRNVLRMRKLVKKKILGSHLDDDIKFTHFMRMFNFLEQKCRPVKLNVFSAQLDMWMASSIVEPSEYWSKVIDNIRWHRVFVEKEVDVFTSKDGWKIFRQSNDTDHGCWVLRDPTETDIETRGTFWEFQDVYPYEFFSKEKRYGRSGATEMDIKFGPAHFPEGTVVELFVEGSMKEPAQFTVDSIFVLGARNYLLTMKEKKPEGRLFGGESEEYNLAYVRKIIKRGEGKIKLVNDSDGFHPQTLKEYLAENKAQVDDFYNEHPEYPRPRMRKGEHLFGQYDTLITRILAEIGTHPDHYGKWINSDRIFDAMKQCNFGRTISQFSPLNDDWLHFWIFDVEKLVAFIRKNQRRIFWSKHECEKMEDEIDKKNASELMFYHD